jgi:uncharacterized RDD family membrane protein YckC
LAPAGLWRRLGAGLVDTLVGAIIWSLAAMWLVIAAWGFRSAPLELWEVALLGVALAALGVALHVVYHATFIGGCGQTLGKMVVGITVVRRDGERAGYLRAFVRCFGGLLSALTLGLSSLGVLFTRERRGFGDWLAGTRVVRFYEEGSYIASNFSRFTQ